MLDILPRIRELITENTEFAMATVVKTWRSSPRQPGSCLIVTKDGDMIGSVSGGCVENAVVKKALKVLETGVSELAKFGITNEDAWEVGLSCGGTIEILIEPFIGIKNRDLWIEMDHFIMSNTSFVYLKSLDERFKAHVRTIGEVERNQAFSEELAHQCISVHKVGESKVVELENGERFFIQSFKQKPKMLLIGSAHITAELIDLAHTYGFETIVIDPRDTFVHKTDYRTAPDQLLVNWPQEVLGNYDLDNETYAVILSHDPKIDDEALKILLPSKVRYIGALGSKKTHAKRVERLKDYGFSDEEIDRIHAPIGLHIGAMSAKEIALSVISEVVKIKNLF